VSHRLIEIEPRARDHDGEVTLYIKGFLARGEAPDHFRDWQAGHRRLSEERGWGAGAFGYAWGSGDLGGWPWPVVSAAKTVYDVVRAARRAGRASPAGALGFMAAEHLVRLTARFVTQYRAASRSARAEAQPLADVLSRLGEGRGAVRVVAHSLGCLLAIEAISRLTPDRRPFEVHLCAPACRESDVADRLANLGREGAFLYHARNDLVLETGFIALSRGRALGAVGPSRPFPGLVAVDVAEHFGFWVHHEYKRRFAEFAESAARSSRRLRDPGAGRGVASAPADD